jgi:peptide methionine sulfoxide reductase msrA/msrB
MSTTRNRIRWQLVWGALSLALIVSLVPLSLIRTENKMADKPKYNNLNPDEERVIIHKGTETPFTGEYLNNKAEGTYTCKRCDAALYRSSDKFDSQCGWPSFDDEIPGAVKHTLDADGRRTEITCNNCGGHLGHVFEGEGFTKKNTRHCVNSISLNFEAASVAPLTPVAPAVEKAYFAAGCFWGVEHLMKQAEGVLSTQVGYTGGRTEEPTYDEVCYENTGHAEALEVVFDPTRTNYETLARLFFEIHDPTQKDRQGPDVGTQYRSAIFYVNDAQKRTAEELIGILTGKGYKIATQLTEAGTFYDAEDYHQDYYDRTGKQPYCHVYQKRF